jgi:hypothetical protein
MKIELQVKGKEVIILNYRLFLDEEDNIYLLAMDLKYDKDLSKEINSQNSQAFFLDDNLILELESKYLYFDIQDVKNIINKNSFISFVFLDKNDKIISEETKVFTNYGNNS